MLPTMVGQRRKFSISDALKQLFLHFWSPLENLLKPSLQKIIKTLSKTLLTSECFWCFISFTNQTFFLIRWKFLASGRYFNPCSDLVFHAILAKLLRCNNSNPGVPEGPRQYQRTKSDNNLKTCSILLSL